LIAGNDVSLIAGQNLDNVGTLRAANNLSAVAGNNLVNAGLIEAGNRLDLLAGNEPMAMGAVGASTGAAVTAGTMGANTAAFLSAGAGAVAAGAATNATVSVINNRGNLGAVVKDVTSADALKGYAISGVTAGLTAAYFNDFTGTHSDPNTGKIVGAKLSTWEGVGQFAGNQVLQNGTSTLLSNALGKGGSGSDALKTALFNTLAAASFNAVGDYTYGKFAEGMPPKSRNGGRTAVKGYRRRFQDWCVSCRCQ